jgi:hypothetical protein
LKAAPTPEDDQRNIAAVQRLVRSTTACKPALLERRMVTKQAFLIYSVEKREKDEVEEQRNLERHQKKFKHDVVTHDFQSHRKTDL